MLIPTVFSFKFLKVSTKIENKEVTNIFVHIQNNLSKFPFTITKKYVNCHSFLYSTILSSPKGLPSDGHCLPCWVDAGRDGVTALGWEITKKRVSKL